MWGRGYSAQSSEEGQKKGWGVSLWLQPTLDCPSTPITKNVGYTELVEVAMYSRKFHPGKSSPKAVAKYFGKISPDLFSRMPTKFDFIYCTVELESRERACLIEDNWECCHCRLLSITSSKVTHMTHTYTRSGLHSLAGPGHCECVTMACKVSELTAKRQNLHVF